MRVYKDTVEKARIEEITKKFLEYGLVHHATVEDGCDIYLEFTREILAYDRDNKEYVMTEGWLITEGEAFEFYPDEKRLYSESK